MAIRRTDVRPGSVPALVVGAVILLCSCTSPTRIRLEQPRLSTLERRLELTSEQVYWAASGGVHRVLAEIPLPGAGTGRPTYVLYLQIRRPPEAGDKHVAVSDIRGFLIQARGERRGLTPLVQGTVSGGAPRQMSPSGWKLHLDLVFEDGSRLAGDLVARRDEWRLTRFETQTHRADVEALPPTAAPIMQ